MKMVGAVTAVVVVLVIQLRTAKAHLFCGRGHSYSGHDRSAPGGSEMLGNLYLEYIEEIGTSRSA
jgi:hypothetical protein